MGGCAAINCTNHTNKGSRMHRFPTDKLRSRYWAEKCGRLKDWNPTKCFYLCDTHFTQNQYELYRADGRKLLKWNAIPTIFNFDEPVKKSAKKQPVLKGQKRNNSKQSDLSEVDDLPNSENISKIIRMEHTYFYDMQETPQDISYALSKIAAENVICELDDVTEDEVSGMKREIAAKNGFCEPNEVLNDVTYTLHRISSDNLFKELDHLRENISCNSTSSTEKRVSFEIENVPYVLDGGCEEDVCELKECRGGCTHKTIIENYKMRISELEDRLASMKNELDATKANFRSTRRKTQS